MKKEIKIDFFISVMIVLFLLFYIVAILLKISLLPVTGKYIFIVFMFLTFLLLMQKKLPTKEELILFSPFLIFTLIYFLNLNQEISISGIMIVVNQLVYLIITYIVYCISWTKFQIRTLSYVYYISLPILFILTFVATEIHNSNTIGGYVYFLSFFPLLYLTKSCTKPKKIRILHMLLVFLLTFTVIFATDTRSILLSAAFGLITFVIWKFISSKKIFFNMYFLLILVLIYFIVVVYPNMYEWNNFNELNDLSLRFTGKPLLTGRNTIWAQLIGIIKLKPWLGYGSSVVAGDFLKTSLSAHNLYIQVGLQTGIVGIFFFVLFLFFIWKSFWENHEDPKVILASCFFISILIYQTFEITLTQNQFGLGLLQWIIIGFGLNYSLNRPKYAMIDSK